MPNIPLLPNSSDCGFCVHRVKGHQVAGQEGPGAAAAEATVNHYRLKNINNLFNRMLTVKELLRGLLLASLWLSGSSPQTFEVAPWRVR